jgi:hypothetical protein
MHVCLMGEELGTLPKGWWTLGSEFHVIAELSGDGWAPS